MKIHEFLTEDIELFRAECNFSEIESQIFEFKRIPLTDVQIALKLNMSESNVQAIMRKVRAKIDEVLRRNVKQYANTSNPNSFVVCHTMTEWAKIPDFLSSKGTIYVYSDYRTENEVNIPRIKIGDGVNSLSEVPFATMSITDNDMSYWDDKPDINNNDFGKEIIIDDTYSGSNHFVFPSDGYLMLEFNNQTNQHAIVHIYGANGNTGFEFSKYTDRDNQSKEVFVRKGMRCEFVSASDSAEVKFVPLV